MAGGGTGGHFYPAWALLEALRARYGPSIQLGYVGTRRGLEARVLAQRPQKGLDVDVEFFPIRARGIERRPSLGALRALGENAVGMLQALEILRRFRPQLVIGTGGYAAFGPVFWAAKLGLPTAIHEQNVVPGLVTRLLAPLVDRVWLAYPETARFLATRAHPEGLRVVGVPLRPAVLAARALRPEEAKRALGLAPSTGLILVLGGSHGARPLHEALLARLDALISAKADAQLAILAGREAARLRERLRALPPSARERVRVLGHTPDVGLWMRAADVAVSRAGGVTLAELMALGVPTVAVPWPGAADDHQTANARWWAERGACRLLLEARLDRLADEARALLEDGAARRRLTQRARALSRPEALDQMRREVERCLDARTTTTTRTRTYKRGRARPPARV